MLEGDIDAAVDILDGDVMTGVGDHGERICKAHLEPEVAHMEAKEGEDQDAEDCHIFRSPGGAGDLTGVMPGAFGFPVGQPEGDTLDGVEDDKGIQTDGDDLDKGIMRHKSRVDIEGAAAVVCEKLQVAGHVDDKKEDQEEAGEAHDQFLSDGRGKETGNPVHNRSVCKGPAR